MFFSYSTGVVGNRKNKKFQNIALSQASFLSPYTTVPVEKYMNGKELQYSTDWVFALLEWEAFSLFQASEKTASCWAEYQCTGKGH